MRRLLGKLIPRSAGGRWAAGLGVAAVIGVGIYLVFFVFAFHLIFVDEVVDEEAPEFAVEVDIDELISDALETGPVATTAAAATGAPDDAEVTDQSMSVGEHDASDGSTSSAATDGSAGSAGTSESAESDASSESSESAESTETAGSGDTETAAEPEASGGDETADEATAETEDQGVRVAYVGSFGPRSHPAEGTAVVLTDGTQTFLRFDDDFATDNGPDLNVYLHTAGPDASVDDLVGDFIDLGDLKGNIGAQNFVIPDDIDLERYNTVSVWCVRFRVVFGTAELARMN
ncbi:DM13 domain-containing protein [Candidatus Poriferisodalis sp.]|uniref:DM13 domain-containing protein n=1 Tax=Candidatus Poriferisodalis sp. TaxID=3101277 RepID=UPI003B02E512